MGKQNSQEASELSDREELEDAKNDAATATLTPHQQEVLDAKSKAKAERDLKSRKVPLNETLTPNQQQLLQAKEKARNKKQSAGMESNSDVNTLQSTSLSHNYKRRAEKKKAEAPTEEDQQEDQVAIDMTRELPGAFAMGTSSTGRDRAESLRYDLGPSSQQDTSSREMILPSETTHAHGVMQPEKLVNAFLVEEPEPQQEQLNTSVPYAHATAVEKQDTPSGRRRRDLIIVVCVMLVVGIIVAIVVPLTTRSSDNKNSRDETSLVPSISKSPSTSPSLSPTLAPTMLVGITVAIRLDSKPQETGWRIVCGDDANTIISVPPGTYERQNRTFVVPLSLGGGDVCEFNLVDTAQDGIDGGFYRINYGSDFGDESFRIIEGTTNFTDSLHASFRVVAPPTPSPTTTLQPTTTMAPSIVMRQDLVLLALELRLDDFPLETGFSLQCNQEVLADFEAGTFGQSFFRDTFLYPVPPQAQCTLVVQDSFGDGLCCSQGEGFVRVFLSDGSSPNGFLLAEVQEFGFEAQVDFVASLPEPTASPAPTGTFSPSMSMAPSVLECGPGLGQVSVLVKTDDRPADTSWDLLGSNDEVLLQGGPYNAASRYTDHIERTCVSLGSCLLFTIRDVRGFGLFRPGFYALALDGEEIATGGDFLGFEESVRFGDCTPTASPTFVSPTCDVGLLPVRVELVTDTFPQETIWSIVEDATNQIVLEGGPYSNDMQLARFVNDACVTPDGCYDFTILDSGGNGISNFPNGLGSYTIFWKDTEVSSGGGFGSVDTVRFGNCAPSSAPTYIPVDPCETGFSSFRVALTTNADPKETSWDLVDGSGSTLLEVSSYNESFSSFVHDTCVNTTDCTTFTVYDSFGDGLCCFYGSGGYSLFLDGNEFASGGEFRGPSESVRFGNCDPIPPQAPVACQQDGFVPLRVEILPNLTPQQTTWILSEAEPQDVVLLEGGPYPGSSAFSLQVETLCIDPQSCVTFEVQDTFGDGMANYLAGFGRYTLFLDGVEISSGGEFGFSEKVSIGSC